MGRRLDEEELDEDGTLIDATCVGYLMRMPEVREVTAARLHWSKSQLILWCGGEQPTEQILHAIVLLEIAQNAMEGWKMTPASKGGGGSG